MHHTHNPFDPATDSIGMGEILEDTNSGQPAIITQDKSMHPDSMAIYTIKGEKEVYSGIRCFENIMGKMNNDTEVSIVNEMSDLLNNSKLINHSNTHGFITKKPNFEFPHLFQKVAGDSADSAVLSKTMVLVSYMELEMRRQIEKSGRGKMEYRMVDIAHKNLGIDTLSKEARKCIETLYIIFSKDGETYAEVREFENTKTLSKLRNWAAEQEIGLRGPGRKNPSIKNRRTGGYTVNGGSTKA
ncbi:MAG: hypothetical protein LBU87_03455 [Lactobacillales bacterium]|jgi:rRNA maturation endonuclease Nob1|nr:hypothetical protein [Lactobacillales bacterium]